MSYEHSIHLAPRAPKQLEQYSRHKMVLNKSWFIDWLAYYLFFLF